MLKALLRNKLLVTGLGIVLILFVVFGYQGTGGFRLSTYTSGWELDAQIVGVDWDNNTGSGHPSQGSPSPFSKIVPLNIYQTDPRTLISYDFDDPDCGTPNIQASVSSVRNYSGKEAGPYELRRDPIEKRYENWTYQAVCYWYFFDLQVVTKADVKGASIGGTNVWTHETAMPFQFQTNVLTGGMGVGKPWQGSFFVRFSCKPWANPYYQPKMDNYTFRGYWFGIMDAYIINCELGNVEGAPDDNYKGWARPAQSVNSRPNKYLDDGVYAKALPSVPWDESMIISKDVQSTCIVELGADLFAGACAEYSPTAYAMVGAIVEMKPTDYYLTYTVGLQCYVVNTFEQNILPSSGNTGPIETPKTYVPSTGMTFWEQYGIWIIIGLICLVVVGLVFFWIGMPLFIVLGARSRQCNPYKSVKGVRWKNV